MQIKPNSMGEVVVRNEIKYVDFVGSSVSYSFRMGNTYMRI